MSDYVPSTAMDSFENIGNALDEIRKIESDLVQDLDGSWSQSTSSAQNSPPRDSPTEMMTSSVAQGVSLVEEAENAKLHSPPNTPPWDNLQHEVNFVPQPPKSQILLPPPPLHQPPIVRQSATIAPLPATKTPETEFREAVKKRSRTQFSSAQLVSLERTFATNIYITRASRGVLARELCLTEKQIKIWFQNRRMKENKIYKGSTAPKTNRLAATAVKNLKRLEEKQKDQSIVSRLMSQRQTVMTQGSGGGGGGHPTFISGEDVHQVCAPAQQFHPQYPTAPPPYPAGSQLYQDPRAFYPHQDMTAYQHHHHAIYRGECEKPQFDIPMPYSYGDHPMDQLHDHLMDYPIMSGMMINEMPSSTIAWGNILDRQLTA